MTAEPLCADCGHALHFAGSCFADLDCGCTAGPRGSIDTAALPIPGHVRSVRVAAHIGLDGYPGLFWTNGRRAGSGGYHGIELYGIGPTGAVRPLAVMDARQARDLASALTAEADRLDAATALARPVPSAPQSA